MQEVSGALTVARELKRPLLELRQLALGFNGDGGEDEIIRNEMLSVTMRAMKQVDDLSKIQNLSRFSLEPVAIRAICDEVLEEVQSMFIEKPCKMRVKYSNRQRIVQANTELLKSVVYNFILSAVHYQTEDTFAELKVRETKGRVAVEVRDFGPALPMNVWREMKNGMMQEQNEIAMRPGSSVLGLYIASKFSKYMQAEVKAVRHIDGTSFIVKLPVARQMSIWGV